MKFNILISFIIIIIFNCTGTNLRNYPIKISPNMNPSPEYAEFGTTITKAGLFYHRDSTILYIGDAELKRTGKSCAHSIVYLLALGDSSIDTARVNGAITKVGMIELQTTSYLGAGYHIHCTIIRGDK